MPKEFYELELLDLNKMIKAVVRADQEQMDAEMQRTAWFTAQIMNSSGNYKKAIKPTDLYTPMEDQVDSVNKNNNKGKSTEELQMELLDSFCE